MLDLHLTCKSCGRLSAVPRNGQSIGDLEWQTVKCPKCGENLYHDRTNVTFGSPKLLKEGKKSSKSKGGRRE